MIVSRETLIAARACAHNSPPGCGGGPIGSPLRNVSRETSKRVRSNEIPAFFVSQPPTSSKNNVSRETSCIYESLC